MDTNIIIKGPDIDSGDFLRFIGIWMLITENPGTNQVECFGKNPIYICSGCSIHINQFMSGNCFEIICSALKFSSAPLPSLPG